MAVTKTSWKKGQSGNPAGCPKTVTAFREACAAKTPESVEEIWKLASLPKPSMVKLEALKYLMNQAHGSPRQAVEVGGPNGGAIAVEVWSQLARIAESAASPHDPDAGPG